jgi:hypothetical protein
MSKKSEIGPLIKTIFDKLIRDHPYPYDIDIKLSPNTYLKFQYFELSEVSKDLRLVDNSKPFMEEEIVHGYRKTINHLKTIDGVQFVLEEWLLNHV